MKSRIPLILFAGALVVSSAFAQSVPVTNSTEVLESQVVPASSDFHPAGVGAMTLPENQVFPNENPGILNSEGFANDSLATKFIKTVNTDHPDGSMAAWLSGEWLNSLRPQAGAADSKGRCFNWSAWALDPEVMGLLNQMHDGIMCNGVPFSKGELKELLTSIYPAPRTQEYYQSKMYHDYSAALAQQETNTIQKLKGRRAVDCGDPASRACALLENQIVDHTNFYYQKIEGAAQREENANVALSKLGLFAGGASSAISPDQFMAVARDAYEKKNAVMVDIDPGPQVWHQPVAKITDQRVKTDTDVFAVVSAGDFEVAETSDPEERSKNQYVLDALKWMESRLTATLPKGESIPAEQFSQVVDEMRKRMNPPASSEWLALTSLNQAPNQKAALEADILNQLKQAASDRTNHRVSFKKNLEVVQHEITLDYAKEGKFAVNASEDLKEVKYTYVEVRSQNPDGTVNRRTHWTPQISKLSEVCSKQVGVKRVLSSMNYQMDFREKCDLLNAKKIPDESFFNEGLPPKAIKVFTPKPNFTSENQKLAYEKLLRFMSSCQRYDPAVAFLKKIDEYCARNEITPAQSAELKAAFPAVKAFIEPSYLDARTQGCRASVPWR